MLRGIWVTFLMAVLTVACSAVAFVVCLVRPGGDIAMRLGKWWSNTLLAAAGIRPVYHGTGNILDGTPCLYLANHRSNADIWVMVSVIPLNTRIVAKQSLFRVPIFGWALAASGFIPIDRSNRTSAIRSLEAAAAKIRTGRPLLLFPEGTRSRDGTLKPFKKGAFYLARKAGVPVIPVSIRGTYRAYPPRGIRVHPGEVHVTFHDPLDPSDFPEGSSPGLVEEVRSRIAAGLGEEANPDDPRAAAR